MKKKIYGALVLGSLLLSGGMVSCSDYDDDINSLNERVDGIEKTLADLKAKIEAGSVITSVENTESGVKVTLSNGESFELTNGKDGAAGSTVSVDEEGYWTIDGKRVTGADGQPIKAAGEKGDQGEAGTPGEDGKDGKWYEPNEDGFWYECSYNEEGEVVKTKTESQWIPATDEGVRVVYNPDEGYMLIYGAEGTDEAVRIDITSDLKSLAAIPYILDKETGYPISYFYNIMGSESAIGDGSATVKLSVATSTKAKAHFRLNPANADLKAWNWGMIDRTVITRAEGDANSLLSIVKTEKKNDEMIVTLKSNESLENLESNEHAIAALQGTNKDTKEVIASDYIKVSSKDLKDFSIVTGYDDVEGLDVLPPAGEETDPAYENRQADFALLYNGSLDLSKCVKTWAKELQATTVPVMVDDMVDAGELTYKFELPLSYKLGENETNQQDFVTLDGSVLTINSKKYPNGEGTIGGTPVVHVTAVINNKMIAHGVIKVVITKEGQVEKPAYEVAADAVNLEYSDLVAGKVVNTFTWEDFRQIYDALKITRDEFIKAYVENGTQEVTNVPGVALENNTDEWDGTKTNAIEMSFDPTVIASDANGMVKITYIPADRFTYAPIVIKFPYTIYHNHKGFPEFNKTFVDIATNTASIKGQMINGVWTQKVEISEHFTSALNAYKPMGNHSAPKLEVDNKGDFLFHTHLDLEGETLKDQVMTLYSEIEGDHLDVPVSIVEELANGENYCVKSYTIRFVNPLSLTAKSVDLEAIFPGKMDEEKISYTVMDASKKVVVDAKGLVTEYGKTTYGLDNSMVEVTYSEGTNWAEFGKNNDGTQKLTLDKNVPSIKWENKGTALNETLNTTYKAEVKVAGIAIMTAEGKVTVKETEMPK